MPAKTGSYAVVLAGGGGTRLWPSSRRARPKQLLRFGGKESLLERTISRIVPVFGKERILVVTAADQEYFVRKELKALPSSNIFVEPEPRNTAAAVHIGAAAVWHRAGPESVMAVLPADHYISDSRRFQATLRLAVEHGRHTIATVGVPPSRAETGYGYIRLGSVVKGSRRRVFEVEAFEEKPNPRRAKTFVASGKYLWNSGMFFLTVQRLIDESKQHLPKAAKFFRAATRESPRKLQGVINRRYSTIEKISIDYGIMEKTSGMRVVRGEFGWTDLGSWSALADMSRHSSKRDASGNVTIGDVLLQDASRNIVVSDPGGPFVAVVGVQDLVVVATADGVLVIPSSRAQDVRKIVAALERAKRTELLNG